MGFSRRLQTIQHTLVELLGLLVDFSVVADRRGSLEGILLLAHGNFTRCRAIDFDPPRSRQSFVYLVHYIAAPALNSEFTLGPRVDGPILDKR